MSIRYLVFEPHAPDGFKARKEPASDFHLPVVTFWPSGFSVFCCLLWRPVLCRLHIGFARSQRSVLQPSPLISRYPSFSA